MAISTITQPSYSGLKADLVAHVADGTMVQPAYFFATDEGKCYFVRSNAYIEIQSYASVFTGSRSYVAQFSGISASGFVSIGSLLPNGTSIGWIMPGTGSIVGLTMTGNTTGLQVNSTMKIEVRKNNTAVYSGTSSSLSGVGAAFSVNQNQAAGTNSFVGGDILALFVTPTNLVGLASGICEVHVRLD